ncbi:MAG: 6-phosphogluconolactonase [Hydrogenophilales bacterium]|nr:6-phosphogluconolactonase [Hydrogenophilales bacterium]
MTSVQSRIFADATSLVRALADALCVEADAAIAARGAFHLVLAGGNTPRALYAELARRGAGDARWYIWYGDERCLPASDPGRNSAMVEAAWLASSNIPEEHRWPVPAEYGASEGATVYADWLGRVGEFDVVLLGMGEDGHTASLFPGHDWGEVSGSPDVLAVQGAPKPPTERVSLSAERLNRSRKLWFVIAGAVKHAALARWRQGERLPVGAVHGKVETVVWLDAAAWRGA